jgi:hypothetical protein
MPRRGETYQVIDIKTLKQYEPKKTMNGFLKIAYSAMFGNLFTLLLKIFSQSEVKNALFICNFLFLTVGVISAAINLRKVTNSEKEKIDADVKMCRDSLIQLGMDPNELYSDNIRKVQGNVK